MIEALINLINFLFRKSGAEKPSPKPRTKQEDIHYSESLKVLSVNNVPSPVWITTVQDTGSMDGLVDFGNICILTGNVDCDDLIVGDVVVYEPLPYKMTLHRIVEIGQDDRGRYYRTQGDNCTVKDGWILRDSHIKWLLRAVIY